MRPQIVISCLVVAGLSSPLTARALTVCAPGNDAAPSRIVRFADLNLQSHEGVRVLYFRLAESNIRQRRCQDRAIERAVAGVRSASLTAFHVALTDQTEHALDR
jgi:hypothetical protein